MKTQAMRPGGCNMRRKIESAVRNPAFSRIMLSLLGAETVTVFFVKAKGDSIRNLLFSFHLISLH